MTERANRVSLPNLLNPEGNDGLGQWAETSSQTASIGYELDPSGAFIEVTYHPGSAMDLESASRQSIARARLAREYRLFRGTGNEQLAEAPLGYCNRRFDYGCGPEMVATVRSDWEVTDFRVDSIVFVVITPR